MLLGGIGEGDIPLNSHDETSLSEEPRMVESSQDLAASYDYGWSTYPHLRYPLPEIRV